MNRMQVQVDYRGLAMTITVEADDHIDTSAEDLARCAMGFLGAELEADEPELIDARPDESIVSAGYRKFLEKSLADLIMENARGLAIGYSQSQFLMGEISSMQAAVRAMGGYGSVKLDKDWAEAVLQ